MARDLHELPRLSDRWSHLYLEYGRLEQDSGGLLFIDSKGGLNQIPLDQFALILLGPGTTITHAAIKLVAENNTLLTWCGENLVRLYAHGTGGTHGAQRLLDQARAWADPDERLRVIARLFQKRFATKLPDGTSLEEMRLMEGRRVRALYEAAAARFGIRWQGRAYDQRAWERADPANRALSAANSCLYGICHGAILTAGYSPAIGFVHTGKQLSFVYDIADLYKDELTIPVAFEEAARAPDEIERRVRIRCRNLFHQRKLLRRILPDIAEVLDADHDRRESPAELEGRAVSLADRGEIGGLPGESQLPDPGCALGPDHPPSTDGLCGSDLE